MLRLFNRDLAIDLGTVNTAIYAKGKGIILHEPSVVALRCDRGSELGAKSVSAVGITAKSMLGRACGELITVKPIQEGVVADFCVTEQMVRHFMHKAWHSVLSRRPVVVISIPANANEVERRTLRESIMSAGAREVYLIEEPLAAAIGAGLPVYEDKGSMIVDIGGGNTEIGILAFGGLIETDSIKVAGDAFDEAIIEHIRVEHRLKIGQSTAEQLKIDLGSALFSGEEVATNVRGMSVIEGIPKQVSITNQDIITALQPPLQVIASGIQHMLQDCPAEVVADIAAKGIILTGGSALLRHIEQFLSNQLSLPVIVSERPLESVVLGSGKLLDNFTHSKRRKWVHKR